MKRAIKELYEDTYRLTDMIRKCKLMFCRSHTENELQDTQKVDPQRSQQYREIEDELVRINREVMGERGKFRNILMNTKFRVNEKKKIGTIMTEQMNQEHSQSIKRFWEEKRKKRRK